MSELKGKTVFITGASRGIGRAIALRFATEGANIVIAAKTDRPHPILPETIHTTAAAVESNGGNALPVVVDVRFEEQIDAAVSAAVDRFGGIDVLINNAGAIRLTGTRETTAKAFDLVMAVNARATFLCTRACLPWLESGENPHVLNLAPPIELDPRWLAPHFAYTLSKYGMSLAVLAMAAEFRNAGIAVNGLWPRTAIATSALSMLGDAVSVERCRKPAIVADAAREIVLRDSRRWSGNLVLDEDVLREAGVTDFDRYAVEPGQPLYEDLFVESER